MKGFSLHLEGSIYLDGNLPITEVFTLYNAECQVPMREGIEEALRGAVITEVIQHEDGVIEIKFDWLTLGTKDR